MDFDKSKVYTVITADEVEVGSKGYYADCPKDLEERVNSDNKTYYDTLVGITPTSEVYRFKIGAAFSCEYALFYLVEEPEKKKLRPYSDTNEMIDHFNEHFELIPQTYCLPFLWIKSKSTGRKHLITDCENDCVWIGSVSIKFKDLYEHYTWLDGSPCGIKED